MLPTGHVAAGYLTAYALLKLTHPALNPTEYDQMLWWGMFFGFAPDIDVFWFFFRTKALLVSPRGDTNHRLYISHAPVFWLVLGVLVILLAPNTYWYNVGLLLWLGSWSHFLLDSIEYGVMWLWPKTTVYALWNREKKFVIEEKNMFWHSWEFMKLYSRRVSFYLEILIIICAIIISTKY